jgi:hypothetical protein
VIFHATCVFPPSGFTRALRCCEYDCVQGISARERIKLRVVLELRDVAARTQTGSKLIEEALSLAEQSLGTTTVRKIFSGAEAALFGGDVVAARSATAANRAAANTAREEARRAAGGNPPGYADVYTDLKILGHSAFLSELGESRHLELKNGTMVVRNLTADVPYTQFVRTGARESAHLSSKTIVYWDNGMRAANNPLDDSVRVWGPHGNATFKNADITPEGTVKAIERDVNQNILRSVEFRPNGITTAIDHKSGSANIFRLNDDHSGFISRMRQLTELDLQVPN